MFYKNCTSLYCQCIFTLKRAGAILLLVIFCTGFTETHELLQFPQLVYHYWKHTNGNENLSIGNFLQLHYAGKETNDTDQDEDDKLPFKTYNVNSLLLYHAPYTKYDIKPAHEIRKIFYPAIYGSFLLTGFNGAVFHPPRLS